jgi:hypothetical protein
MDITSDEFPESGIVLFEEMPRSRQNGTTDAHQDAFGVHEKTVQTVMLATNSPHLQLGFPQYPPSHPYLPNISMLNRCDETYFPFPSDLGAR